MPSIPAIIYIGSGNFAAHVLHYLAKSHTISIKMIMTYPDSYIGRRKSVRCEDPCKHIAHEYKLHVSETRSIRDAERTLQESKPDIIVVCSFKEIFPKHILNMPKFGCINIHPSLLPKYRGSTPIQTALYNGDTVTGVSIMRMSSKLDEGDIILQEKADIFQDDTFKTLSQKLAQMSGPLVERAIFDVFLNRSDVKTQDHIDSSYCRKFTDTNAHITFDDAAMDINNKIRGLTPDPGAYVILESKRLKILKSSVDLYHGCESIGTIIKHGGAIGIVCKKGILILRSVQLEGKKAMSIEEFVRGRPNCIGMKVE